MKSRIDTFNDSTFKEIVSSSSTWKELAERFGYESTLSSNLKAVADFDDGTLVSEINDINNLIALCPNHHWEYDNGLLEL